MPSEHLGYILFHLGRRFVFPAIATELGKKLVLTKSVFVSGQLLHCARRLLTCVSVSTAVPQVQLADTLFNDRHDGLLEEIALVDAAAARFDGRVLAA